MIQPVSQKGITKQPACPSAAIFDLGNTVLNVVNTSPATDQNPAVRSEALLHYSNVICEVSIHNQFLILMSHSDMHFLRFFQRSSSYR